MSKFKLLMENFLIYGFGGIMNKIIPLVMIPIVTRMMPDTSYFGINDMFNTIISLSSSLAIMGMYDAMYRMFFEKEDNDFKKDVCSTAFVFTFFTSIAVFVLMILFRQPIAELMLGKSEYGYIVCISAVATLVGTTNNIVATPTRMQNKRGIYIFMNILSPVLSYSMAIPLLLKGYYLIALPAAGTISAILNELVFIILNHKWFSFKRFSFKCLKPMLFIALPLLPNLYWIFNSFDKIMVTNMLGMEITGIYSVGSKLGQVGQLIYTAFALGWQYFAFSTMKAKDQVTTNSKIFEYLGVVSFSCSLLVFALSRTIFQLLFSEEYLEGYTVAPYLFLSPLLLMLFQVSCNQFMIIKKTWPNFLILSAGAIVTVIFDYCFIPIMGIEGAAIAAVMGPIISNIICVLVLIRMKLMKISAKFIVIVLSTVGYITVWRFFLRENAVVATVLAIITIICYILIYKNEILSTIKIRKNSGKKET